MSLQDLAHLMEIENLLDNNSRKEHNIFDGIPNSIVDSKIQFTAREALHKKAFIQDNIEKQNSDIDTLLQNSANQIGGVQVGFQVMSPSSVAEQDIIPSFDTINWGDIEDESQYSLITDLKPKAFFSAGVEESKTFQGNTGALQTTSYTNQSSIDPKCMNSSMNNEELSKIQTALEDSTADIFPFSKFLNQNGEEEDNNTLTDQNMDDMISIIENDQAGSSGAAICQNAQQGLSDSIDETEIPLFVQDIVAEDNMKEKNDDVDVMLLNTGNKIGGLQFEIRYPSPNLLFKQENKPSFSTINLENCGNKSQFPQLTGCKPPMNSSVVVQDSKACHNTTAASSSTYLPHQIPALNLPCIQITGQHGMKIKASNQGPLRTKPGRCSRDEVPLYLMQEPKDKQEKRRWRRAKTAYEHRLSKKNALDGNSKKIEDLQNELSEMKNQLKIVTAERDAFKNSFLVLSARTSK